MFTLMYCGNITNVNRDLKMHIEKALEVCYLWKKTKSMLDEGFSSYSDLFAEKKFRKKRNLNYAWALMGYFGQWLNLFSEMNRHFCKKSAHSNLQICTVLTEIKLCKGGFLSPFCADVFNLRSFDLSFGLGLSPLYSVSFSSMHRNIDHWLRDRDREMSTVQYCIWKIGAMDKTSGQPLVKLILFRSISLKGDNLEFFYLSETKTQ